MCIICREWEKEQMTAKEAFRAIGEIINTSKDKTQVNHLKELAEKIITKEIPETEVDEAANADWWNRTHPED